MLLLKKMYRKCIVFWNDKEYYPSKNQEEYLIYARKRFDIFFYEKECKNVERDDMDILFKFTYPPVQNKELYYAIYYIDTATIIFDDFFERYGKNTNNKLWLKHYENFKKSYELIYNYISANFKKEFIYYMEEFYNEANMVESINDEINKDRRIKNSGSHWWLLMNTCNLHLKENSLIRDVIDFCDVAICALNDFYGKYISEHDKNKPTIIPYIFYNNEEKCDLYVLNICKKLLELKEKIEIMEENDEKEFCIRCFRTTWNVTQWQINSERYKKNTINNRKKKIDNYEII